MSRSFFASNRKKRSSTLRLPTKASRLEILANTEEAIKSIMGIIAESDTPVDRKEYLANFLLYILNIVDIEHAKISYEDIKRKKKKGTPSPL